MGPPTKEFKEQFLEGSKVRPAQIPGEPVYAPHFYEWQGKPGTSKLERIGVDLMPGEEAVLTGPAILAGVDAAGLKDELLGPTDKGWVPLWSGSLGRAWVAVDNGAGYQDLPAPKSRRHEAMTIGDSKLAAQKAQQTQQAHGKHEIADSEDGKARRPNQPEPVIAMDLVEGVLCGLSVVALPQRGEECKKRRKKVRQAVKQVQNVLNDCVEAIKLRPSKNDRLTASNYHICFRHLHWVLDRSRQMQEVAEILEDYDTDRMREHTICLEYALLSVDIVGQHDSAMDLLHQLTSLDGPASAAGRGPKIQRQNSKIGEMLAGIVTSCGARTCIRDINSEQTQPKQQTSVNH